MSNHIFENAGQPASQRFTSLETLYDSWTIRQLEATSIGPGWQCWEVGGGGGSILLTPILEQRRYFLPTPHTFV